MFQTMQDRYKALSQRMYDDYGLRQDKKDIHLSKEYDIDGMPKVTVTESAFDYGDNRYGYTLCINVDQQDKKDFPLIFLLSAKEQFGEPKETKYWLNYEGSAIETGVFDKYPFLKDVTNNINFVELGIAAAKDLDDKQALDFFSNHILHAIVVHEFKEDYDSVTDFKENTLKHGESFLEFANISDPDIQNTFLNNLADHSDYVLETLHDAIGKYEEKQNNQLLHKDCDNRTKLTLSILEAIRPHERMDVPNVLIGEDKADTLKEAHCEFLLDKGAGISYVTGKIAKSGVDYTTTLDINSDDVSNFAHRRIKFLDSEDKDTNLSLYNVEIVENYEANNYSVYIEAEDLPCTHSQLLDLVQMAEKNHIQNIEIDSIGDLPWKYTINGTLYLNDKSDDMFNTLEDAIITIETQRENEQENDSKEEVL